ncbi:hypothetical protein RvY_18313 [Ramazzottius varieornatus]|uniref:Uncharacterized protein n=1 Tax=Ramazzottius varieornatus TaxID=947166 RepID=A0A1D1W5D8_RAMVA|nr:hypothetical protein RvY_18313 [Ramazzottius varieornatus]
MFAVSEYGRGIVPLHRFSLTSSSIRCPRQQTGIVRYQHRKSSYQRPKFIPMDCNHSRAENSGSRTNCTFVSRLWCWFCSVTR